MLNNPPLNTAIVANPGFPSFLKNAAISWFNKNNGITNCIGFKYACAIESVKSSAPKNKNSLLLEQHINTSRITENDMPKNKDAVNISLLLRTFFSSDPRIVLNNTDPPIPASNPKP